MANGKHKSSGTRTPLLERLLGGIGVLMLLACVGFLIYEGVNDEDAPGEISATVKRIVSTNGTHIVAFALHNAGSQTLSNVHLSAYLFSGEREVERVQTVIDYLPGHSDQEGGFYFKNDPRKFTLEIRPEGYQEP